MRIATNYGRTAVSSAGTSIAKASVSSPNSHGALASVVQRSLSTSIKNPTYSLHLTHTVLNNVKWDTSFLAKRATAQVHSYGIDYSSQELIDVYGISDGMTPMAKAIQEGDTNRILELVDKGWNRYVERHFVVQAREETLISEGVVLGMEEMLFIVFPSQSQSRETWRQMLSALCSVFHTSVSLSNEFDLTLENLKFGFGSERKEFIFELFNMGLNPNNYSNKTCSLQERLERDFLESIRFRRTNFENRNEGPAVRCDEMRYVAMKELIDEAHRRGWSKKSARTIEMAVHLAR